MNSTSFTLRPGGLTLRFFCSAAEPVMWRDETFAAAEPGAQLPKTARLVELQATGFNHDDHHGNKYTRTEPAGALRYQDHSRTKTGWEIRQAGAGLEVVTHFLLLGKLPAFRTWTTVRNTDHDPLPLEYVSSLALSGLCRSGRRPWSDKMRLHVPDNTWYAECQWRSGSLPEHGFHPAYAPASGSGFSLGRISASNLGTWSSVEKLPFAVLENTETRTALAWEIEHNGSWHWEIGDTAYELYLRAAGPTYREGHWSRSLAPGESFESVPVTVAAVRGGLQESLQALTGARRAIRRPHADNKKLPVIFNDYMNCLFGDPTTEKLLPIVAAAAKAGAELFVIDAGWYAEQGETWWESVGAWQPSKSRFPGGLREVVDEIRRRKMVPGLWLEIEVMGIQCPLAKTLPDSWFFLRQGRRVIDHGRYQLDFRNPKVRRHASRVVARLVKDFGIGYLKMDYNINAGPGTDRDADSPGDGLLAHNRAYLRWMRELMDRHPGLVVENCASGGMRMDYAQLAVHPIQSVTDQTDYRLNAVIAAACASAVTPEQAAIWSYPLKEGDEEETIFNMVNALLLRIHQGGRIHEISDERLALIKEGFALYKRLRRDIPTGLPFWPLGLPRFGDGWIAFGLDCKMHTYLSVWRLDSPASRKNIPLEFATTSSKISCIYPAASRFAPTLKSTAGRIEITLPQRHAARLLKLVKTGAHLSENQKKNIENKKEPT